MTEKTSPVLARLHDGERPVSRDVELEIGDAAVSLQGETFPFEKLRVSPRAGSADRFVSLPTGGELQVADGPWLDQLPSPERSAHAIAWLEQRTWATVGSLLGLFGLGAWFWAFGLPWLALQVALRIPFEVERQLGEEQVAQLGNTEVFSQSEVEAETRAQIETRFRGLVATLPKEDYGYELRIQLAGVGPNAFAFPGGIIVITDELVELCSLDEVTAVIAHELAHARKRHVMQSVISDAGIAAALKMAWDEVSSSEFMSAPELMLSLGYSRALEEEADEGAFELLRSIQLRPALLGDALARLDEAAHQPWPFDPDLVRGETEVDVAEEPEEEEDPKPADSEASASGGAPQAPTTEMAAPNWVELGSTAPASDAGTAGARGEKEPEVPSDDSRFLAEPEPQDPPPPQFPARLPRNESWSFLSTHPITAERIARARAATP